MHTYYILQTSADLHNSSANETVTKKAKIQPTFDDEDKVHIDLCILHTYSHLKFTFYTGSPHTY